MASSKSTPSDVVYVIGAASSNTVKIGVSNQPDRRLREIQFMSPVALSVLWISPGSYDLERDLHHHFAQYRSHGEWFTFPREPVKTVQNGVALLQLAVDDRGNLMRWPDAPVRHSEENRHYWLNVRIREKLYTQPFTFTEAAEVIGAPLAFVEKYGGKLAEAGSIVDQGVTRNGQQVYRAQWDEGDRWALLGPRSR